MIVADTGNNRIRRIKDGQVTTIAGGDNGKDAYGMPLGGYADGEHAKARFSRPRSVAVDSKGNIYVADTGNNVIRKITPDRVYTFAGTGEAGYADGKGNKARFNCPSGLAVDANDNLYVADTLNNVIRMITPSGLTRTVAGKQAENGGYMDGGYLDAIFNEPSDICIDKEGAVYILDSGNQMVRKLFSGTVTTIAGFKAETAEGTGYLQGGFKNGPVSEARFNFPKGIAVADNGTLFIADTWNNRIRAVKTDGTAVTVAGNGNPGSRGGSLSVAEFSSPSGIVYHSGTLYISDSGNNSIRFAKADSGAIEGISDRSEIAAGITGENPPGEVTVQFNGRKLEFADAKPYIQNGRAYLPLRFICEAWGAEVTWDGPKNEIGIKKESFSKTLSALKAPIVIKNGRSMIDPESLSIVTGLRIEWFPEYSAVIISKD